MRARRAVVGLRPRRVQGGAVRVPRSRHLEHETTYYATKTFLRATHHILKIENFLQVTEKIQSFDIGITELNKTLLLIRRVLLRVESRFD